MPLGGDCPFVRRPKTGVISWRFRKVNRQVGSETDKAVRVVVVVLFFGRRWRVRK